MNSVTRNKPLVGINDGYQDSNDADDSDDSDDDDNSNSIASMYTFMWKASSNFLARVSVKGKAAHIGIEEVKCPVTLRTKHQQKELVALGKRQKNDRFHGAENISGMKYFILHWKSKLLRKFFQEEKKCVKFCIVLRCIDTIIGCF